MYLYIIHNFMYGETTYIYLYLSNDDMYDSIFITFIGDLPPKEVSHFWATAGWGAR